MATLRARARRQGRLGRRARGALPRRSRLRLRPGRSRGAGRAAPGRGGGPPRRIRGPPYCRRASGSHSRRAANSGVSRFRSRRATLVPRPETETLVEAVLRHCRESRGRSHPWRILDLGTGSGCIARLAVDGAAARHGARRRPIRRRPDDRPRECTPSRGRRSRAPCRRRLGELDLCLLRHRGLESPLCGGRGYCRARHRGARSRSSPRSRRRRGRARQLSRDRMRSSPPAGSCRARFPRNRRRAARRRPGLARSLWSYGLFFLRRSRLGDACPVGRRGATSR